MDNKYYQIFVDGNVDLAASVVLKCEEAAKALNQWVLGYTNATFDEHNPRTWKYYRNICGEYFPSDERMYITSVDTLQQIEFSKTNLEFHRATKKAYAFGTTYYKELVERYPDQDQLIHGILYPADMEEAIAAYDGKILAYPSHLVESTEPSLIINLQNWINGVIRRWHNPQYQNTDNLYLASMLGVLYAMMPGAIENIRKEACMTHEAHSYHVQQYLASHSKLDKYMPYMTRSQAMYFYHNLAYIENNNGREEIFQELLQHTFTERNLPVGHFSLLHSTKDMPGDSLTPLVVFEKTPLNTLKNIDNRDQFTLSQVLNIEDELHAGNRKYREEEQIKIANTATHTVNPNVPTKLLQSTVIDYSDSDKYRLADIIFQHWSWLAHKNAYRAFVTFTIPATASRISLTPLDAFAFYAYAFCKGMGFEITKLPTVVCKRVQRIPAATVASMREVCEVSQVSEAWLKDVQAGMPILPEMISQEAFRTHCQALADAANHQYGLTSLEERMTARAQKEAAIARLWAEEKFTLGDTPNQNYADWFASRNLVVRDLTQTQLLEIANVILTEATGDSLASVITLRDIQRAMRDLLLELSSYSIQLALNINTGSVLHAGFNQVRPDEIDVTTKKLQYVTIPTTDPFNIRTYGYRRVFVDVNKLPVMKVTKSSVQHKKKFSLPSISFNSDRTKIIIPRRLDVATSFKPIVNLTSPNPRNLTIVPGMEKFLKLPLAQQLASYVDTWAK